ncbi:hypothetical protein BCR34DRAFT_587919 [Clohesyomyces aquaticus]|uniref:Uncharacterized protein n=1 Tax=Clohesyomyces aquaticus TaxID=1231657 RepID=A0A1Y1ZMD6_9PLEO|nr:hypothetical protein BCR34DRAFT_587919 [Clohesyomyces aquaticus]
MSPSKSNSSEAFKGNPAGNDNDSKITTPTVDQTAPPAQPQTQGESSNYARTSSTVSYIDPPHVSLFPGLYSPSLNTIINPSVVTLQTVVDRLMDPPIELYTKDMMAVRLNKVWAVGVAGAERFSNMFGQHKLNPEDPLATSGMSLGLSGEMLEWLISPGNVFYLPAKHFGGPEGEF